MKTKRTQELNCAINKVGIGLTGKLVLIVEGVDEDFFAKLPKKQEKDLMVILQKLTVTEDVDKA